MASFRFLQHHEINKKQWDTLLSRSRFPHPCLQSWYLDVVAPGWSAFVDGDYSAVFPIFLKKKFAIQYAAKPPFVQQLGLLSQNDIDASPFVNELRQYARLIEIPLNEANSFSDTEASYNNYCLDLSKQYPELKAAYSKNTKRNINKAVKNGLRIEHIDDLDSIISFFKQNNDKNALSEENFVVLKKLLIEGFHNGQIDCFAVYGQKEPVSLAVFVTAFGRSVYSLVATTGEGNNMRASFFLVDQFVQEKCGRMLLLDFEGSNIEGIARFYSGFGAINRPYPFVKLNALPWPISLFKK